MRRSLMGSAAGLGLQQDWVCGGTLESGIRGEWGAWVK